jgi:hypothetical protein
VTRSAPPPTVTPRGEPPKAAAPKTAPAPQPQTTTGPAPKPAPALTQDQARQQLRELQTKQRQDLRAKDLKPAERRELMTKQREEVRDLIAKQRDQRNVTPGTQPGTQPVTDAQARLQDRQQTRDLIAKQRQELRDKNITPAARRELIAKQRDELRNLRTEQANRRLGNQQQAGQPATDAQARLQDRQQMRDLVAKQRQELRNRNLTPAQRRDLIAKQRDELRNLRAEQVNRRLGPQQQQAQQQQLRRNGKPVVTADAARAGRFAGRFQNQNWQNDPNWQAKRAARIAARLAARQAWRHGHAAFFVAWAGPVFYPYAYSDIFEYTFWPYAYDEAYWAYVYDDFFDSIFFVEEAPYSDYAYYGPSPRSYRGYTTASAPRDGTSRGSGAPRNGVAAQVCTDPGKGITAWPFQKIEQTVRPNADQRRLLDDLKRAAAEAADTFKASCDQNFPLTPPGRLAAMTNRIDATLQAVRIVRPALEAFYNALTDEQKARFTAMGPDEIGADRARAARSGQQQQASACSGEKRGLTDLPIERIEDAVRPTQQQQAALDNLDQAMTKAVGILMDACPDVTPLTPVGRLEAMEKRLAAMVDAGKTVQPAMEEFYASLSNEQKARFNTLGQKTAERE